MKNRFAKLFELEEAQVLVTKHDEGGDENEFKVRQTSHCDGLEIAMTVGFDDEEKRDAYFEEYERNRAVEFLNRVNDMLNESTKH